MFNLHSKHLWYHQLEPVIFLFSLAGANERPRSIKIFRQNNKIGAEFDPCFN